MTKSVTMSFSVPLELSIQMEECMENKGFNRSELIKTALIAYLKSQDEKKQILKTLEDTHETVLEIKGMVGKLLT